jgi:hypothetical protein
MNRQLWTDKDIAIAAVAAWLFGIAVGAALGFEWAYQPVVDIFVPLKG